jgi:hypothetical protein
MKKTRELGSTYHDRLRRSQRNREAHGSARHGVRARRVHQGGAALQSDAHEITEREAGGSDIGVAAALDIDAEDTPLHLRKIAL